MKTKRNKIKFFLFIWASILLIVIGILPIGLSDFILPPLGGGMIHCDPQMTENLWLQPPTTNVGRVWYCHGFGGEKRGTWGNGIAGNGRIAACLFANYGEGDNLIIYDYYGNRIWSSGPLSNESGLNWLATASNSMVDINDRVIACDNKTIILVNASNHDDVHVNWTSTIRYHNETGYFPIPYSPTIVDDKIIILPTQKGPLLAFNVSTGEKIGDIYLGKDGVNESYYGIPDMPIEDFTSIISNPLYCPYHYDSQNHVIEWISNIPYGVMPPNYFFQEVNVIFMNTPDGVVGAFDNTTGELLANNSVAAPQLIQGKDYYSTINSALVLGHTVYLACEKEGYPGKLFAVDVNVTNQSNCLSENWSYTYSKYSKKSQATPTLIDDTLYFDGNNRSSIFSQGPYDPFIYAVYLNGTEKWNVSYENMTWFTFTKDPRGGFWYEDCDQVQLSSNTGGNKLVRFSEENGSIIQEIDMKTLLNDTGMNKDRPVLPSSDMTICGNQSQPIMLISANHQWFHKGKWVIAINLTNNNSVLWKIELPLLIRANYANGDYTILTENNQSRILFQTWMGGVMSIGSLSNCSFQIIDHYLKDSPSDDNPYDDTVQVNYTIQTSLPDRVLVKATLISQLHPILCRYKVMKYYNISSNISFIANITDSLNITLPPRAPMGAYFLQVFLYNSSGEADRDLFNLFDYMDFGIFANDTYSVGPFFLYPPNDPPEPPHQPWGEEQLLTSEKNMYTTHTTDPNGDSIWYQWKYETNIGLGRFTYYTRWIMGGPKASGENITKEIQWPFAGTYNVWVRAKDNILNPNVMSDWSPAKQVTVTKSDDGASWNLDLLNMFTSSIIAVNQQTSCNGLVEGIIVENTKRGSLNWTWDFGDGNISYGENVSHNYNEKGNYTVNLTLRNGEDETSNYTTMISVDILRADFNITGDEQPNKTVYFTDASSGTYQFVNWTWDFGDGNESYNQNTSHVYTETKDYNVTLTIKDTQNNTHVYTSPVFIESFAPDFISVIDNPDSVGYGNNVTINVDFFDNQSGVKSVMVNITYPDNTSENFTMEQNVSSEHDYQYIFNDTWQKGVYNYSVYVVDNANNTNCTSGFNFTVSAEANITVCTTKDSYTGNEFINLTDPPGNLSPSLGYELLDGGAVLHLWNQYDNYYFNTSSGIQLTNHKDEYWSHNVLMLGYYNNDQWNLLYRTDELTGFNRDIEIDESSYVNVTLWKDLSYAGYPFRLAIRYHLGINDCDLTVIPYIKNLGTTSIPYVLGFGWELKDIQINMTAEGDYIVVDQESYYLNQTLENVYTDLNETVFYLMDDSTETQTQSLYMRWDPNLVYKLQVKSRSGQQNTPVTLFIRVGTLAVSQQKSTQLQWYDASQETYYFDAFDANETWENDPELMTDETEETFASTRTDNTAELCNGNTCEGDNLGTIQKVELRVNGYYEGDNGGNITLRPIFGKTDGENYTFVAPERPEWSQWFDITNDDGRGGGGFLQWTWSEVDDLDCDVEASVGAETTLFCSMIQLRVTYNTAPSVSNPYPPHGTNGIILQPQLNITVSDPNGDTMNVTWYSNSTSSLLTLRPNANGSITELQRYPTSQNANYKCVDDTIVNDNDYVYWSGTSWKKDTYNLADHGSVSGVIHSVTVYARCNRGGFGQFPSVPNEGKIVIRSDGSYYYGNEFALTSTFTYYSHTWSVNPATGYAWNWSAIDALEAGISFIGNEGGSSKCSQVYVMVNYTNPNTWYQFGMNSSVSNGVYRQQFFNASVNGQWWYWKVKADDGTASTWSSVYKFYTGYQSKIENTGETSIKGYLLMQVHYYNETTENWFVDNDTVNETTPRIINSSCQLGLDTIFNGLVRASDLTHGTGTYRVYAAFRDPDGNILRTNDDTDLVAWWQFSKT